MQGGDGAQTLASAAWVQVPGLPLSQASQVMLGVNNLPAKAGDIRGGLDPGSGRSLGEGNGNPLQYSCLENPMDQGAWRATVPGVT